MSRPFFRSVPVDKRKDKVLSTNVAECTVTMADLWEQSERLKVYSRRI
jgi:hypothetical protein